MNEAFLDTSYALALSIRTDQFHQQAVKLSAKLEAEKTRLITTRAVLLEIGNTLAKTRLRAAAVILLNELETDTNVKILAIEESLYRQGLELYQRCHDKEWGLIDCISIVVMRERNLDMVLTADHHFRQAGFRALLLET